MAFPARVCGLLSFELLQGRIIAGLQITLDGIPMATNQAGLTGVTQSDLVFALNGQNAKHSQEPICFSYRVSTVLLFSESRSPERNHLTRIDAKFPSCLS